jgi:ATP/maltotriose-dependent transcriptional regulator MalT
MDEVNSLMREALSFLEAGEPGMAEESYAAAVALAAQHLGEGHPVTASLLGHLARSCLEQTGKEAFATSLLERQVFDANATITLSRMPIKICSIISMSQVFCLFGFLAVAIAFGSCVIL